MSKLLLVGFVGFGVFLFITFILYLYQDHLIFHPQNLAEDGRQLIREQSYVEEIILDVSEDVRIHGWLVNNKNNEPAPLLIYFGGNAEEVSHMIDQAKKIEPWSILLMNYRGYGASEGSPSEQSLFHDAHIIYDTMVSRPDVLEDQIAVMGRSLGSGVAVYLADTRPIQSVILISPFDSITRIAKGTYPFVPVQLFLKHPFDSISKVPNIEVPLLSLIASEDRIIPPESSMNLIDQWAGTTSTFLIEGKGHNNIHMTPVYWEEIRNFLNDQFNEKE